MGVEFRNAGEPREILQSILRRSRRCQLPQERLKLFIERRLGHHTARRLLHLARLFRLFRLRREDLRDALFDAGYVEREENRDCGAHGRFRFAFRFAEEDVEGFGIADLHQDFRGGVA